MGSFNLEYLEFSVCVRVVNPVIKTPALKCIMYFSGTVRSNNNNWGRLSLNYAPFEAYLLEVLSEYQITIPEMGVIKAESPPIVIITSNRTREIHDALKRRCFYHWVDYPDASRELEILQIKAPHAPEILRKQVVHFVQKLRKTDLFKQPGVAETIDWTHALVQLDYLSLDSSSIDSTLGVLLKYQDDIAKIQGSEANSLLTEVRSELSMS